MAEIHGKIPLEVLIKNWQGEFGWDVDRVRLLEHRKVVKMTQEIVKRGLDSLGEVFLGTDGKVWDGLHRIAIALELGIPEIKFKLVNPEKDLIELATKYKAR